MVIWQETPLLKNNNNKKRFEFFLALLAVDIRGCLILANCGHFSVIRGHTNTFDLKIRGSLVYLFIM